MTARTWVPGSERWPVRGASPRGWGLDSPLLRIEPRPVIHTSHPTVGYEILAAGRRAVWAPEFWEFPAWARGADLMFAEAAGWNRPIRFTGGVGGHLGVLQVAEEARRMGVRRLVFAHIGRPTIRALIRQWRAASVRRTGARWSGLPPDRRLKMDPEGR
jgi:GNAT superfamily N-acetyltransferase